ncbi:unnamed protein product, partial [Thlaspi arvense]
MLGEKILKNVRVWLGFSKMMKNRAAATPEFANSKTLVWWDMDDCPVPNGYDPSRLGPRIDTELKKLGYNGPLTIIAMGDLEGIPHEFLRALADTGVVIKHQPPVTIMVISSCVLVESTTEYLCESRHGYNFLVAYPPHSEPENPHPPSLVICGEWLWNRDSLLKGRIKQAAEFVIFPDSGSAEETRGLVMGGHMFSCELCEFDGPGFEDLTTHLDSPEHAEEMKLEYEAREHKFLLAAEQEAKARKNTKVKKILTMTPNIQPHFDSVLTFVDATNITFVGKNVERCRKGPNAEQSQEVEEAI